MPSLLRTTLLLGLLLQVSTAQISMGQTSTSPTSSGRPATATVAKAAIDPAAAQQAATIFRQSAITSGLCLHIDLRAGQENSGNKNSGRLTAALAQQGRMIVHALVGGDAALQQARSTVQAAGLAGRAMIEKASGDSLPYLREMARLVVVEDMNVLAEHGISREEILRVMAPGGVLCEKKNGAWTSITKPRSKQMDEWTHTRHGADGNLVSSDRVVQFPFGLRWIDGTPSGRGGFGSCASCRAVVLAGGRCFTVSVDDPGDPKAGRQDAQLMARDAFSGFPIWTLHCKATWGKVELDWRNSWPLVATDTHVYTRRQDDLIIVDADTGTVKATCDTKYTPRRLVLLDDCLVTACWEKRELHDSKARYEGDRIRSVWWPAGKGSVEAFDPQTGKPKWSLPLTALTLVGSDGTAYLLTQEGNPPTKQSVVAVDLATGKQKWRVPHTAFGKEPDACLNFASPDYAVVSRTRVGGPRETFLLAAKDGKIVHRIPGTTARCIVGGELWCNDGRYDLKTLEKIPGIGVASTYAGRNVVGGCVPPIVVGHRYITSSRQGSFLELPSSQEKRAITLKYPAARGACIQGMVPANGMFYTAQNNCACIGAQVPGFLAIGPSDDPPAEEDFTRPRPVEKGPAFGTSGPPAAPHDWPMYRQNIERSAGTDAKTPETLKLLWTARCAPQQEEPFATAYDSRIGLPQPLTPPIIVGKRVFVAAIHQGQMLAIDSASGETLWQTTLASRIDSAPTYHNGLLLAGCHDGWVYALRATDGALAYRVRIAPAERRLVAHGLVESVWPAVGAVLVYDGTAYATAGRSTKTDGGIAMVAFRPTTGETVWANHVGDKYTKFNDAFAIRRGELAWFSERLDPKTGKFLAPAQRFYNQFAMIDGGWTMRFTKRSGRGFALGRACSSILAWNGSLVVSPSEAVRREVVDIPKPAKEARAKHPDRLKADEIQWRTVLKPHVQWSRVHAMALSGNAALFSGSAYTYNRNSERIGDFLWRQNTKDGKPMERIALQAPPVYDGLSIADGRVYLSLQDGSVQCWGE